MCERALDALDLTINVKKSCCLRIGARNNVVRQPVYSMAGTSLPLVTEIIYLGIHIVNSKNFKITTEQSRRHFYRAANAIFSRIGKIATFMHQMYANFIIWPRGFPNEKKLSKFSRFCRE